MGDLEPDSCGLNLKVVVTDFKTVLDRPKFDGSRTKVGEAIIGDDTGSIVFTARDGMLMLEISHTFNRSARLAATWSIPDPSQQQGRDV